MYVFYLYIRYDIMLNCWDENSTNRASFTELRKQFDAMLSSMTSKVSVVRFGFYFNLLSKQYHFFGKSDFTFLLSTRRIKVV